MSYRSAASGSVTSAGNTVQWRKGSPQGMQPSATGAYVVGVTTTSSGFALGCAHVLTARSRIRLMQSSGAETVLRE
eukprot:CAMPEP_0185468646 /NCGR_PEP_ID=MMETSP1365-20130426/97836_1 /TAXON_ID=38817 /ORGANISM="Gephyrocapsa oceanica, Strain RCC1303" /LENGTH=75 /DNA_ID=CAMNT_0028075385 /DNA_START=462 /DNA_END=689 /DNA_ORIENTATION=-